MSLFYFAIDVMSVGKRGPENSSVPENYKGPYGILGDYNVDATDSHGLFIQLLDTSVFVDIRKDEFLDQRAQWAQFLFKNQKELESNLTKFIDEHPEYKTKKLSYIGLHSKFLEQGEVFWNPNGHTLLKKLNFTRD